MHCHWHRPIWHWKRTIFMFVHRRIWYQSLCELVNYWTGLHTWLGPFWRSLDDQNWLRVENVCEWRKHFTMRADKRKSNTRSLLNEFPALSLARSVNLFTTSIVVRWKITISEKNGWKKKKISIKEINWPMNDLKRRRKKTIYWLHERDLRPRAKIFSES